MMKASDALMLSRARLTDGEKARAALLEQQIHDYTEKHMEYSGLHGFTTAECNNNVIAEVNRRLRRDGWFTQWVPAYSAPTKGGKQQLTGWKLDATPVDAAYTEAEARSAN